MHPPQPVVPRRRRLPVVLAAVAGLVIGGGGVGLGWFLSSDGGGGGGGGDDVSMACDIVTGLGSLADMSTEAGYAQQLRLGAARELAMAAAETDGQYKEFSAILERAANAVAQTFKLDNPETTKALNEAKTYCADR